ncbi:MAG: DUF3833 domain-containing protein [Burkholderiaceae bacterium]
MKRRLLLSAGGALSASALTGLAGCASQAIEDYASEKPVLDLATYFNGQVDAWGIFTDRSGKVVRRFTVLMNCRWEGSQGVLDEDFMFSDGTREKRIWTLTKHGGGRYTGRAADVVGEASGQTRGNAFFWTYTLALPVDGKVIEVQLDDWMYLVSDKVMLNKAVMRKFGLQVGELTLSFTKR